MISFKKKFIFIHISKTGGSSIEYSLQKYAYYKVLFEANGNALSYDKHWSIEKYSRHPIGIAGRFLGKKIDINRFFKFCFVRNPWDRLVSNYFYLKSIDANYPYTEYGYPTFKDWILGTPKKRDTEKAAGTWVDSFRCFKHNSAIPLQLDMIRISGKTKMDFIGHYETLQEDFDKVCEFINIRRQQLPWKNISYKKNYKEYFDEETRKIVARQFSEDIEFFGYTF